MQMTQNFRSLTDCIQLKASVELYYIVFKSPYFPIQQNELRYQKTSHAILQSWLLMRLNMKNSTSIIKWNVMMKFFFHRKRREVRYRQMSRHWSAKYSFFLIDITYNSIFHVFIACLQWTNPLFAQKVEDNVKLKNFFLLILFLSHLLYP